jgi:hypothetical protein
MLHHDDIGWTIRCPDQCDTYSATAEEAIEKWNHRPFLPDVHPVDITRIILAMAGLDLEDYSAEFNVLRAGLDHTLKS